MKSILISEADYQEFTDEQKKAYSDFIKLIKYSKKIKPLKFISDYVKDSSNSERWVFLARCKKSEFKEDSEGRYKESELIEIYNQNKDLRSQEQIISDYEKENKYDVWNYFNKFRNKKLTLKQGLKYCKKLEKHEIIVFGKKRVYPLKELEKI
jgi:hypothetical protein